MKKALIGAFVLSVMLVPAAALATPDELHIFINGDCFIVPEGGGGGVSVLVTNAVDGTSTTLHVKPNGTTLGTCRVQLIDVAVYPLDEPQEYALVDGVFACIIDDGNGGVTATEWEQSINRQGKVILQCKAEVENVGAPPGNPNFCDTHVGHEKC